MSIPLGSALRESITFDSPPDELAAGPEAVSKLKQMSNPNLFAKVKQAGAWSPDFCEQVAPQANRYAMSMVGCWSDAEELVQEAFCRLIDASQKKELDDGDLGKNSVIKNTTRTESSSKAILFATIRNLSIDQLRKQSRRPYVTTDPSQIPDKHNSNDESRFRNLEATVEASISQLPENWSDALQLKINGELSYEEISKILNATHAQVRTWIYRARKQLQIDLKKNGLIDFEPNSQHSMVEKKQ